MRKEYEKFKTAMYSTRERASGTAYSLSGLLLVVLSFLFSVGVGSVYGGKSSAEYTKTDGYIYASFLIPQLAFLLTGLFYLFGRKTNVRSVVGKCRAKWFLIAFLLQFGLLSLSSLNDLFLKLLHAVSGYESEEISVPSMDGGKFFLVLFVIAVIPPVLEEFVFRGILLDGLKSFGTVGAVLLCGGLFALYHQNPAQTVYQFICGTAFALVVIRSGSVLPTVFSHFLNNLFILVLYKFGVEFSPSANIVVTVLSAVCLVAVSAYLLIVKNEKENAVPEKADGAEKTGVPEKADKKGFFRFASVGIALFALIWISVLLSGV